MWSYNYGYLCHGMNDYLEHHGILGQKWGIRRFQNPDGSLTPAGKVRYSGQTLFVSGSSKTQDKESGYYRRKLPVGVRNELNKAIKEGDKIIVGDAPGIDRQVQDYLNKKGYMNVEIYGPGKKDVRYSANSKWKKNLVDAPQYKEGTDEWRAEKDKAMSKVASKGLAVIIDNGGAGATRNNIKRLSDNNKDVSIYELSRYNSFHDKKVKNGKYNNYDGSLTKEGKDRYLSLIKEHGNNGLLTPKSKFYKEAAKEKIVKETLYKAYRQQFNNMAEAKDYIFDQIDKNIGKEGSYKVSGLGSKDPKTGKDLYQPSLYGLLANVAYREFLAGANDF